MTDKRLFQLNKCAAEYFHFILYSKDGQQGLDYLKNKRGLPDDIIKKYQLGFAPDSWDRVIFYLKKKNFTDKEIFEGNLSNKKPEGTKYYSMFRNRVMFPIYDIYGNIIAFGGRVLEDEKPKYLNSSDTPVFKKSQNLYSLNFAKSAKMKYFILAEGYMDVIALNAAGFTNAVATLGTALTEDQALLIAGCTDKVLIAYDSDEAGQNATDRAIAILKNAGIACSIINMQQAKDPDEYIKKFGKAAFQKLIDAPVGLLDYQLNRTQIKNNISTTIGMLRALNDSITIIENDCEENKWKI